MKWDDLSVTPTTTLIPNAVFTHKEKLHIQKHIFINPYPFRMLSYRDKMYAFISRELLYLAQLQKIKLDRVLRLLFSPFNKSTLHLN